MPYFWVHALYYSCMHQRSSTQCSIKGIQNVWGCSGFDIQVPTVGGKGHSFCTNRAEAEFTEKAACHLWQGHSLERGNA